MQSLVLAGAQILMDGKELGLGVLLRQVLPVPKVTQTFAASMQLAFDQARPDPRFDRNTFCSKPLEGNLPKSDLVTSTPLSLFSVGEPDWAPVLFVCCWGCEQVSPPSWARNWRDFLCEMLWRQGWSRRFKRTSGMVRHPVSHVISTDSLVSFSFAGDSRHTGACQNAAHRTSVVFLSCYLYIDSGRWRMFISIQNSFGCMTTPQSAYVRQINASARASPRLPCPVAVCCDHFCHVLFVGTGGSVFNLRPLKGFLTLLRFA